MIRMQIVEWPGANLHRELMAAMRSKSLQTFFLEKRGKKVRHVSLDYPGWMNWNASDGVITCEIISPRKPGSEWRFFHAFLGRLASRYAEDIHSINVQFPSEEAPSQPRRKRTSRRARR
jgi:hypothetical protein